MDKSFLDKQFITLNEFKQNGFSYYKINNLIKEGSIKKINRSTYENTNYKGEYNDFSYVCAYVPNGVICELSAASYYQLTDYYPPYIEVAIDRNKKVSTLPKWPSINLHYYNNKRVSTGIVEINEKGNNFKIYNIEKTIIDILSFRNKNSIEESIKILKNYLNRKDRDLNKLRKYAKEFRCEKILRTYLEALL